MVIMEKVKKKAQKGGEEKEGIT